MSRKQYGDLDDKVFRILDKRNARLEKSYQDLLPQLRAYYFDIREKWGDDGVITFADLNKYSRYENTKGELQAISNSFFSDVTRDINDDLREVYALSYDTSRGIIEKAIGSALRGELQISVLEKAMKTPVGGLTMDLRFDRLRVDLADRMLRTVTTGIQNGSSWREIASQFKDAEGVNQSALQRIVRTEGHRLEEQAKLDVAHKSRKPLLKEWVSARDSKVRASHQILDGTTIPLNDDFTSPTGATGQAPSLMNSPEDDINCRCYLNYKPVEQK